MEDSAIASVAKRIRALRSATRVRKGIIHFDHPVADEEVVGEAVGPTGWAYAPGGISSVEILVNGRSLRLASSGLPRPDVADELKVPEAAASGWSALISTSDLREGENVLRAIVRGPTIEPFEQEHRFRWRKLGPGEVPYDQVDLSGERYDPRYPYANSVAIEHRARYHLAASIVSGRRVLDAGCGFGYGARTLARAGAASVDAIDANVSVIEQARRIDDSGVRFHVGDVRAPPYADDAFDVVVCFEVLEHMVEHAELLDGFRRILTRDGILLVSTPNRERYLVDNPWHLKELTPEELESVLHQRFANVSLVRQQLHLATILGDEKLLTHADPEGKIPAELLKLAGGPPGSEIFDIGVASDGPLPSFNTVVAIGDARDELVDATIAGWRKRAMRAEAEAAMLRTRMAVARTLGQFSDELPEARAPESPEVTRNALRNEMTQRPFWMYNWDLGDLGRIDIPAELDAIHDTRRELIEPYVRQAIRTAGPRARVLDLACSEGWFSHRALEWGAESVVGLDVRPANVRRASLIRDQLGISRHSLAFHEANIFSLPDLEPFDVVLMLGLVYHLENPMGAFRIARALTRSLLVVESQLTQQREPIMAANGGAGVYYPRAGSFACWFEQDQDENPVASHGGALSLIPNEAALLEMAGVAGFVECEMLRASPHQERQYRDRERAVMIARAA